MEHSFCSNARMPIKECKDRQEVKALHPDHSVEFFYPLIDSCIPIETRLIV